MMRRITRASVAASESANIDKENQIPLLGRNQNAKATAKGQLYNVVKGRTDGKFTLSNASNNAVSSKGNENVIMSDCVVAKAVKGSAKYNVDGQPEVSKAPKFKRCSKEQKAVLNNISNKPLASSRYKDGKREDGNKKDSQLVAVPSKGPRREVNRFRQPKVHSHKTRKRIRIQRSCSHAEKVVVGSSDEEEEDCIEEEKVDGDMIIISDDDDEVLSKSEGILVNCEQLSLSEQLLKSQDSSKILPGLSSSDRLLPKIAGADRIFPNHTKMTDPEPIYSEADSDEDDDFVPMPRYLHDIDYEDDDDPSFLNEYVLDIYEYMRTQERENVLTRDFLSKQSEITDRMRSVLIDWLVLANYEYKMTQETLFLTVAIIDRYLQKVNTPKNDLQLVGVAAMWVASKYEEVTTVEVAELVHLTDNSYTTEQVRQMECNILKALDFQLSIPLEIQFLRRFTKAAGADPFLHAVAKYLMELTLVPYNLAHYPASKVAAAALVLSNAVILSTSDFRPFWTDTMVFHSKYELEDLTEIVNDLAIEALNIGQSRFSSIRKKFATSKLMRASVFVQNKVKVLQHITCELSRR